MARLPCILLIGQSNIEGRGVIPNLSDADSYRYFGKTQAEIAALGPPIDLEVPGINFFTTQMPVANTGAGLYTATGGSGTTYVAAAAGWTPGAEVGNWLYIISGTAIGQVAKITANTATTLTLDRTLSPAVAGGETAYIADSGTLSEASLAGSFRRLRLYFDNAIPSSLYFATGYEYNNNRSRPLAYPGSYYLEQLFGPELELTWQMQREVGEDLYVIKLGIDSSFLSRYLGPDLGMAAYSWFDGGEEHNDWHPQSTSTDPVTSAVTRDLFGILVDRIFTAARGSVGSDLLDIRGVFVKEGESDSTDEVRAELSYDNMRRLRDALRAAIDSQNLSETSADKVPFIIAGHDESVLSFAGVFNAGVKELADEDLYTGYFDTNGFAQKVGDPLHLSEAGYKALGETFYTTWKETLTEAEESVRLRSTRETLSTLRTKVKKRMERNDVSNDATDNTINSFINDSLREFYNTVGENAWFRRNTMEVSISAWPAKTVLPRAIRRLLTLERVDLPGYCLEWKLLGYTNNGCAEISVGRQNYTGTVLAHFMKDIPELVEDGDTLEIPNEYCELIVMLACKRMAETWGNAQVAGYYAAEVERLYKYVKRDCLRYERGRNDQLYAKDLNDLQFGRW